MTTVLEKPTKYYHLLAFDKFKKACLQNNNNWLTRRELADKLGITPMQTYTMLQEILKNHGHKIKMTKSKKKYFYKLKE